MKLKIHNKKSIEGNIYRLQTFNSTVCAYLYSGYITLC